MTTKVHAEDTSDYRWWYADLLSEKPLFNGRARKRAAFRLKFHSLRRTIKTGSSCVLVFTTTRSAKAKLGCILQGSQQLYWALIQVIDVPGQYDITLSPPLITRVMVYLAKAWTNDNEGLFDCSHLWRLWKSNCPTVQMAIEQTGSFTSLRTRSSAL